MLLIYIVKSDKCLVGDRGNTKLRTKENIHCHLRYGYFGMVNQIVMATVAIDNGGRLIAKLYDKSDDFTFPTKFI
jgi:hypothetical protein